MSGEIMDTWRKKLAEHWRLILVLAIVGTILVALMSVYLPPGVDWEKFYRPAAREMLFLRNPFNVPGYPNPPWALLPFLPLALLPSNVGRAIFLLISLCAFAYAAYELKARPLALAAFLASPPVIHSLLNANIDWIPVLGFVLPPRWGLFLVLTKPQVGIGVALFWLIEAWRKGRVREVVRVFWPVTAVTLLSFLVYGFYLLRFGEKPEQWWNASLWPMSIPVGLALMAAALRKREIRYAMGAAPCLSPYVLFHAWSGALAAVLPNQLDTLVAVAGLWILVLMQSGL